nr:helix-turn-helix domain-containing protein [Collinsella tanakaei]
MLWEVRPNSHFTALFEARVLVMAMSGATVTGIARRVRESDSRIWAMLGRAVAEARAGADYSGVTRVGIDDTARARGQRYISVMADVDGRRVVAVTEGRDRGAPGRLCDQLEERGGEDLRDTDADASGAASDDRNLAFEFAHGEPPFRVGA